MRAAIALDRAFIGHRELTITLLDQNTYHSVIPRLAEVASANLKPGDLALPIRRLLSGRRIEFVQARVEGFRPESNQILTDRGPMGYRYLVLALGSETATYAVSGVAEHGHFLRTLDDARQVREAVDEAFRRAAWKLDPKERAEQATIVIGGAGYSGVELAGALSDRVLQLAASYRMPVGVGQVVLIDKEPRILPEYDRALSEAVEEAVRHRGVQLRLGQGIASLEKGQVRLADGQIIACGAFIWTGGVQAPRLIRESDFAKGRAGRLLTDSRLRLIDYSNIFAVGDLALPPTEGPNIAPPSAQLAVVQADIVGRNIASEVFRLFPDGSGAKVEPVEYAARKGDIAVSLGQSEAVAEVRGIILTGWRAVGLRRAANARYLEAVGGASGLIVGLSRAGLGKLW